MLHVAVLCEDKYHPEAIVRQGLEPLQTDDIQFDFLPDRDRWNLKRMRQYGVIVLCRGNARSFEGDEGGLSLETQADFRTFVREGGGLLACHAGTVGYRDQPDFLSLVGGVFVHHPPAGSVTVEYVNDFGHVSGDPLTFQVHDEHYLMETTGDIAIFLHSISDAGTQPAGWTRLEGSGRVCALTPGHFAPVWTEPAYQHTLQKILCWCAGIEDAR